MPWGRCFFIIYNRFILQDFYHLIINWILQCRLCRQTPNFQIFHCKIENLFYYFKTVITNSNFTIRHNIINTLTQPIIPNKKRNWKINFLVAIFLKSQSHLTWDQWETSISTNQRTELVRRTLPRFKQRFRGKIVKITNKERE